MSRDEIISFLGADWTRYLECTRGALRSDVALLQEINANILAHSGKMLRPMLTLLSARACGEVGTDTLGYAAAVELLHNATLLHDDVADRSEERRGAPTVMSLIGASPAVLVGDFWLSRAVDLVIGTRHSSWAVEAFARTLTDLAEGEMLQQQKAAACDTTQEDYRRIIYGKTASLFRLSCLAGARSADAAPEVEAALGAYGEAVGMAFQIKDDIFDYEGGEIGKPAGQDLTERKITAPLLELLDEDPRAGEIRARLRAVPGHPEHCAEIRRYVLEQGGTVRAARRLDAYIDQAVAALSVLSPSPARDFLAETARYIGYRKK